MICKLIISPICLWPVFYLFINFNFNFIFLYSFNFLESIQVHLIQTSLPFKKVVSFSLIFFI